MLTKKINITKVVKGYTPLVILFVILGLTLPRHFVSEAKGAAAMPAIRICSAREPVSVDRRLDALMMSPLFNYRVQVRSLSDSQARDLQAITQTVQQGVMRDRLWPPGATITVGFLSGAPTICARIQQSAIQWEKYSNIHFQFVTNAKAAQIRIGVDLNNRSESVIGLDANNVKSGLETMHFGWLTLASSQAAYDSVVLHEFGHALGALHEHQLPSTTIMWNKPVVYQYCETQLGWKEDDVNHNIFEKYTPEQAIFTSMDPKSIMMYSFPAKWTTNNISTPWNYSLSEGDKQFMALRYHALGSGGQPNP